MKHENEQINRYNKHIRNLFAKCGCVAPYDFKDKGNAVYIHNVNILNRTQQIFSYDGLPDTITKRNLELLLQVNGYAGIAEVKGKLYAFYGGLGGEPDAYYMPTIFTVANPALNFNKNLKIDEECVIIPNDSLYIGLIPILTKYNTLAMESELSLQIALVNSRITSLISAGDDSTLESARKYLKDVWEGKLGTIAENQFLDGIRSQPYASTGNSNNITAIIEALQYARATLYNELGLSANFNMKREALNSAESSLNNDILLPLIDDMLESRREALEKVNQMFGTNISVKLASSWEDNQQEIDQGLHNVTESETETETTHEEDEEKGESENEKKTE